MFQPTGETFRSGIYVKPGGYRVTAKIAEASVSAPGARSFHLESQGQLVYKDVDLFALAGLHNPVRL